MAKLLSCFCIIKTLISIIGLGATHSLDIEFPDATLMLMTKEGLACFEMALAIPGLATLNGVYLDLLHFLFDNTSRDNIKSESMTISRPELS